MSSFSFRPSILAASAGVLFLAASSAGAETAFECRFQQLGVNGVWIPEVVVVALESDSNEAVVFDPLIEHFVGDPMPAKIETDNSKRTTFVWELKVQSGNNQYARMKYRMTMMKADKSASISATPQGYAGNFQSRGSCKPAKA